MVVATDRPSQHHQDQQALWDDLDSKVQDYPIDNGKQRSAGFE